MKISGNYGTFLGPLIKVMELTDGDVLEMGVGFFSTPYLHYKCLLDNRLLVSYDNDKGWIKRYAYSDFANHKYASDIHKFIYVENWDEADIEKPWDVVLLDHSPSERRHIEAKRLAEHAKYIIIHDSNEGGRFEPEFHYSEIYPLFKYRKVWDKDARHADLLSNFAPLDDLW